MRNVKDLFDEIDQLPADTKWQLVKHMLNSLEKDQLAQPPSADYQRFLRETYGNLRDTPIERGEQGDYEEREPSN